MLVTLYHSGHNVQWSIINIEISLNVYCVFVCRMQIINQGTVKLEFSLQVHMDPSNKIISHGQGGTYDYKYKLYVYYYCNFIVYDTAFDFENEY